MVRPYLSKNTGSKKKHTVMCFVGGFLPGFRYGGPVSSVAALSLLLKKSDVEFRIIAPDRDLAADLAYDVVIGNEWNDFAGHSVYYVSSGVVRVPLAATLRRPARTQNWELLWQ